MADVYRVPKAVLAETDLPAQMTAAEVVALRSAGGAAGEWAERVTDGLRTRAAVVEEIDMTVPDVQVRSDLSMKILAAIAALGEIAEELGLVPDDDAGEAEGEVETNAADLDVEERRTLIDAAEKRSFATEVRATTADDGTVLMRGYAAVFDKEATGLPFREVIRRGAFADSLSRGDEVYLLINHNTDELPLARRSSGTLDVGEDEHGLYAEARLDPSNPRAAELISALSRNDVSEMSFAFRVPKGGEIRGDDGLRELRQVDLFEVSVTTWGAYNQTDVGLRSAEEPEPVDDALALQWRRARLRQQSL